MLMLSFTALSSLASFIDVFMDIFIIYSQYKFTKINEQLNEWNKLVINYVKRVRDPIQARSGKS